MPAHPKRPLPTVRMVELLANEKRELLKVKPLLTPFDFALAWERCWQQMVTERAWPHATVERRGWRRAMEEAMYPEARACFIGRSSGWQRFGDEVLEAMDASSFADTEILGVLVA